MQWHCVCVRECVSLCDYVNMYEHTYVEERVYTHATIPELARCPYQVLATQIIKLKLLPCHIEVLYTKPKFRPIMFAAQSHRHIPRTILLLVVQFSLNFTKAFFHSSSQYSNYFTNHHTS